MQKNARKSNEVVRDLMRYFLQGLIYTGPVAILIYVVYTLFTLINDFLHGIGLKFHPLVDPIIGIIFLMAIIITIGILGSSILFKPLFIWMDQKLERAPVIKTVYTSVKDVMNAFIGSKKKFDKPVLVRLSANDDVERIGFLTRDSLQDLGLHVNKVAVYLPFSYAISGILYIVPSDRVRPLDVASGDVMKFVISGGVAGPADEPDTNNQP